ncbi:sugar phosphate nucleotidyltransferase [Deltaproteobacteria bacterium IMCC39524]|nr:sugar phosphate nucleotidyltransferase [Deltaproteobacteria bacterium IMCC39524]
MSGGSGTGFWPLSRELYPRQLNWLRKRLETL